MWRGSIFLNINNLRHLRLFFWRFFLIDVPWMRDTYRSEIYFERIWVTLVAIMSFLYSVSPFLLIFFFYFLLSLLFILDFLCFLWIVQSEIRFFIAIPLFFPRCAFDKIGLSLIFTVATSHISYILETLLAIPCQKHPIWVHHDNLAIIRLVIAQLFLYASLIKLSFAFMHIFLITALVWSRFWLLCLADILWLLAGEQLLIGNFNILAVLQS